MSTGPWPDAILRLLADINTAVEAAFDRDEAKLSDFRIGINVTSYDDHIATLYEEGWDFTAPEKSS